MSDNSPNFWFEPKRVGFGVCPATWQGWLITLVCILAIAGAAIGLDSWQRWAGIVVAVAVLGVAMLLKTGRT